MKLNLLLITIIYSIFCICSLSYAQNEMDGTNKNVLSVRVNFEATAWNVFLSNNEKKRIQYVFNNQSHAPRDIGIEFWDQEKKMGRRIYIGDYGINKRDGFGMDVRFIEPGETVKFKIDFLSVSSSEKETLELWRRLSQSGYCYCRVFFKKYASPMYPVLFKDKKTQK